MQVSSLAAASSAATVLKPKVDDKTPAAANDASDGPSVRVTLSDSAKAVLAGGDSPTTTAPATSAATATKAVDGLLASSGEAIYGAAISSLKTYPEDLSTRQEAITRLAKPTPEQNAEATTMAKARNDREEAAFMHFAHEAAAAPTRQQMASLMSQYYKAYGEYYDGLSPEEQNSDRYRGTRETIGPIYQSWSAEAGKPTDDDLSSSGDPILMLFDKIKKQSFKVDDAGAKSMLQDYKDSVAKLISSQTDPAGNAAKVDQASSNFNAVQSVVDKARSGDADAFGQLQSLANDPSTLDSFLTYAKSLAQA